MSSPRRGIALAAVLGLHAGSGVYPHAATGTQSEMSATPDERNGTDLLAREIREEAGRLVHHPVAEMKRLESVAEEGESAATPLILVVGVTVFLAVIAAVVMTVVFVAYYEG